MHNTDVEGIKSVTPGILTNVKESSYMQIKREMIEKAREKERINNMEKDITSMKEMLKQILAKVNNGNSSNPTI